MVRAEKPVRRTGGGKALTPHQLFLTVPAAHLRGGYRIQEAEKPCGRGGAGTGKTLRQSHCKKKESLAGGAERKRAKRCGSRIARRGKALRTG